MGLYDSSPCLREGWQPGRRDTGIGSVAIDIASSQRFAWEPALRRLRWLRLPLQLLQPLLLLPPLLLLLPLLLLPLLLLLLLPLLLSGSRALPFRQRRHRGDGLSGWTRWLGRTMPLPRWIGRPLPA